MTRADSPSRDTDPEAYARYLALIGSLPKEERLGRAFALSAFVREVAWAGAERDAGAAGPAAVRARFFEKLYGPDMPESLRQLLARL